MDKIDTIKEELTAEFDRITRGDMEAGRQGEDEEVTKEKEEK